MDHEKLMSYQELLSVAKDVAKMMTKWPRGYAYLGEGKSLTVLDVSDPSAPVVVGRTAPLPGTVSSVAVAGDPATGPAYAYALTWDSGLRIVDVSEPANPVEVGFYDGDEVKYGRDVAVVGDPAAAPGQVYACVPNGAGLTVLNVSSFAAIGCGGAIIVLPLVTLSFRRKRRMAKLATQLPDVFEMMSQALRAGHSLAGAIQLVYEQMPPPIATEFAQVYHEQNLGIKIEDALQSMANRIDSLDVRFFVTAVMIQRQTGGDLAEVLVFEKGNPTHLAERIEGLLDLEEEDREGLRERLRNIVKEGHDLKNLIRKILHRMGA